MKLIRVLALCLLVGLVLPVGASAQDLSSVRAERARLQERLDAAATRLGELESSVAELSEEQRELVGEVEALEAEVAAASERIAGRVRTLYMRGETHPVIAMLGGSDPQEAVERAAFMQRLVATDNQEAETAGNARVRLRAVLERLARKQAALDAALDEQSRLTSQLEDDLEAARELEAKLEEEERRRREEEERKRREEEERREQEEQQEEQQDDSGDSGGDDDPAPDPPPDSGGKVCPVDRPRSFTDTWGAPRSGGRRHQGTDILAPRGQTVRAIVGGVWDIRSYGASAGNWGILRGRDGNHYYYMHLERHTVGDGARVDAGDQVATNGDTGNARGTTPHVHFEYHPGGGYAVNPYPMLKDICG